MNNNPYPEFDGHCAFSLSIGKRGVMGSEKHKLHRNGKLYLFSNPVAKLLFRLLPNSVKKAEKTWSGQ